MPMKPINAKPGAGSELSSTPFYPESGLTKPDLSNNAKFVTGSTLNHVVVMTSAGAVGLMTLFIVDLVDMFFLSLLGETALAAAVGYAGSILFFTTSLSIAIAITSGALVSKSIGQQKRDTAARYATNVMAFGMIFSLLTSLLVWINIPLLLDWLGATGRTKLLAEQYLRIIIPSMVILGVAMAATGMLRAVGDAKRSMYSTVSGGLVNAILDPILIFGLNLGIEGAAIASVIARAVVMFVALNGVIRTHHLLSQFSLPLFLNDMKDILRIAGPAMLTNVATPIGNAYVMISLAKFGDGAVAGMSIVGRLIPVAFGMVFALSGAVGPIIGQNFGAGRFDRVRATLRDALLFCTAVVTLVSIILFLIQNYIVTAFSAGEEAASLIRFFCTWVAISFIFNGCMFVANATFNNLGYAHYATIYNVAKATIGTLPFVYFGAMYAGAPGVIAGQAIGSICVGALAIYAGFRIVNKCALSDNQGEMLKPKPFNPKVPHWPQTDTRG